MSIYSLHLSGVAAALVLTSGLVQAADVPQLSSNPLASQTLLLDFDDYHQERVEFDCPVAGSKISIRKTALVEQVVSSSINQHYDSEQFVRDVWEVVSDYFSPFDVNVTTIEPSSLKEDTGYMVRVVIGDIQDYKGLGYAPGYGCKDKATYLDSSVPNVAFVNFANVSNIPARILARRVAHEAGHVYGLQHQSHAPALNTYAIMGYSERPRHVWTQGINQQGYFQDDVEWLQLMIGPRVDDHGDIAQDSSVMTQVEHYTGIAEARVFAHGVVEWPDDEDVMTFRVIDEGIVTIYVRNGVHADAELDPLPASLSPMLRSGFEIQNADGSQVIASGVNSLSLQAIAPNAIGTLPFPGQPAPPPTLRTGETYRLVVFGSGAYEDIGQYTAVVDGPVADLSGPRVTYVGASCRSGQTIRIRVQFDQAVNYRWTPLVQTTPFAELSDAFRSILLLNVAGVPTNDSSPSAFELYFATSTAAELFDLDIGVDPIQGFGSNENGEPFWMDQNNDGINGDAGNAYHRSARGFALQPPSCHLPSLNNSFNLR